MWPRLTVQGFGLGRKVKITGSEPNRTKNDNPWRLPGKAEQCVHGRGPGDLGLPQDTLLSWSPMPGLVSPYTLQNP